MRGPFVKLSEIRFATAKGASIDDPMAACPRRKPRPQNLPAEQWRRTRVAAGPDRCGREAYSCRSEI